MFTTGNKKHITVLIVFMTILPLLTTLTACEKSAKKIWTKEWQSTSPLLEARSGAGAAEFGHKLYIAGGASIEKGFDWMSCPQRFYLQKAYI